MPQQRGRKIAVDESTIRRLWASELRNDQLAEALGVPHGWLETIRERYGLPPRKRHAPRGALKPDPTGAEIESRASQIRERWSPAEADRRWQLGGRHCELPCYRFVPQDFAFSAIDG